MFTKFYNHLTKQNLEVGYILEIKLITNNMYKTHFILYGIWIELNRMPLHEQQMC